MKISPRKLTILLTSSLTIMSVATIAPALPQMGTHFSDVPNAEFLTKLILTIPAFFIAFTAPIAGRIIDKFGRLKLLFVGLVLYALAGTSGIYLDHLFAILAGRAILGIAVGMIMTVSTTLIGDYFEGEERRRFVGFQVSFISIGGVIFIQSGGFLADLSWRGPFFIYFASLLLIPMVLSFLEEPVIKKEEESQIVPGKRHPLRTLVYLCLFFLWVLFFIVPVQLPFFLKDIGVEKNVLIGFAIAFNTLFAAISSSLYSRIKKRLGYGMIFIFGFILMSVSYVILGLTASYSMAILAMMFSGTGLGMIIPNTNYWVIQMTPAASRGSEIGKLTTFRFMGQFLSPILVQPIIYFLDLSSTFLISGALLIVLAILFFSFRNKLESSY